MPEHRFACHRHRGARQPRTVVANDPNESLESNVISNTKYTVLSFIPMILLDQFSRVINLYFLIIACLQLVPSITPVNPLTTWLPLLVIFGVTAAKEAYDDIGRRRADVAANARRYTVVRPHGFATIASSEIRPGDVLRLWSDEELPCDCVLLSSSDARGAVFIQTSNLDGESNLKTRIALLETRGIDTASSAAAFAGCLDAQAPDEHVYRFDARLRVGRATLPLTVTQLLPQATMLRNVEWAYALAVYCGNETKFGRNKKPPVSKYTATDDFINAVAASIFVFQLALVAILGAVGNAWQSRFDDGAWYLGPPGAGDGGVSRAAQLLIVPARFLLLNSTMIPISLKLTLDLAKLGYARFIEADHDLASAGDDSGTPARCNSTALGEDLGQIRAVLTDKTGTLTENVMVLRAGTIRGVLFGDAAAITGGGGAVVAAAIPVDERLAAQVRRECAPGVEVGLRVEVESPWHASSSVDFFRCLALCNDVVPVAKAPVAIASAAGTRVDAAAATPIDYKASSPDEEALVKAAAAYSIALRERDGDVVTIQLGGAGGVREQWTQLAVVEFTSERKRMSVVCRSTTSPGAIRVFTKGADDVMIPRIARNEPGDDITIVQRQIDDFAAVGMRTLVLAYRDLSSSEFDAFNAAYTAASASIGGDRDVAKEAVASRLLEVQLTLLGATAIEDRLQEGVPRTIRLLRDAGVALWMLTGDKASTALAVARASQLKAADALLVELEGDSGSAVDASIRAALATLHEAGVTSIDKYLAEPRGGDPCLRARRCTVARARPATRDEFNSAFASRSRTAALSSPASPSQSPPGDVTTTYGAASAARGRRRGVSPQWTTPPPTATTRYCVLVRGGALDAALAPERRLLFAALCAGAETVICCRVTPKQKAAVVRLVKEDGTRTLAIGDGGNDVAMIQEAHVGIGIAGKEGLQAARASDVHVFQFRALSRLLLVHGRYSYTRTALIAQYSFYKSFCFCAIQIGFAFVSGFSGVSLFNSLSVAAYNAVLFVPIVLFIVDRDISQETALAQPQAYRMCNAGKMMTAATMVQWLVRGLWHAAAILGLTLYGTSASRSNDYESTGMLVFCAYLWVQDFTMLFSLRRVTVLNLVTVFGMHALAVCVALALNATTSARGFIDPFSLFNAIQDPLFWLSHVLVVVVTTVPPLALMLYSAAYGRDYASALYRDDAVPNKVFGVARGYDPEVARDRDDAHSCLDDGLTDADSNGETPAGNRSGSATDGRTPLLGALSPSTSLLHDAVAVAASPLGGRGSKRIASAAAIATHPLMVELTRGASEPNSRGP